MGTVKDRLLEILEDLDDEDIRKFKFFLNDENLGIDPIPRGRLDGTHKPGMADLMLQHYPLQVLVVTKSILERIQRYDLAQKLTQTGLETTSEVTSVINVGACPVRSPTPSPHPFMSTSVSEDSVFLESEPPDPTIIKYQKKLQSFLRSQVMVVREGMSVRQNQKRLDDIFVELFITEGGTIEINQQHENDWSASPRNKVVGTDKPIDPSDIFKSLDDRPLRTVLTAGVAGIGKTILVKKFVLDWAEGKKNQDVHLLFPLRFSELNPLKEKTLKFAELVHECIWETKAIPKDYLQVVFSELQESGCRDYQNKNNKYRLIFVLDGLDESRLDLDLKHSEQPLADFDVTQSATVAVLLRALIRGNLLPCARIWITTRPGAAKQIHGDFIHRKTLVRGFNDPQKEEYFKKKFRDHHQASTIISHIRSSRSLFIMCHIPVFCLITSIVLKEVLKNKAKIELPTTLTEMYSEFLTYQISSAGRRCGRKESIRYIKSLAKLAYNKLSENNLFCEKDLKDSGISSRRASLYVEMLTEVFEEVDTWKEDTTEKKYSFIHLSLQEYLAALHVVMSLINNNRNVLSDTKLDLERLIRPCIKKSLTEVHAIALKKTLECTEGHLDLFLRFILGLSLKANQDILKPLLKVPKESPHIIYQETIESIQTKIRENTSPERTINLFYCLKELKENSLEKEIQRYSLSLSDNLSPLQWQALVFLLLTAEDMPDVFDLRKYWPTEECLLRLLPVVKYSNKALLMSCNLSQNICLALGGVLCAESCRLRELDLSDNELSDTGVRRLCAGLEKRACALETLRLSGCMISDDGCKNLVSALKSNPTGLRELDLSFNHPGDSGIKELMALKKNPQYKLEILKINDCGKNRLVSGVKKYFCNLTLDQNTAHKNLKLSHGGTKVTAVKEKQPCSDHMARFDCWLQVLCLGGLTGRTYWEVTWKGKVYIGVTYKGIIRKGQGADSGLGANDHSWTLICNGDGTYSVQHEHEVEPVHPKPSSASRRVAVYLDHEAGTVTFYKVSFPSLIHLHTYKTQFTEPLYPAFGFGVEYGSVNFGSLVSLTEPEDRRETF